MTNHDAASTTTVISERDQRRIRAAMSAMPYAATERVPKPWVAMGAAVDADAVVAFLEGHAEVLGPVAAESDKHRHRLFPLAADVAAVRPLLRPQPPGGTTCAPPAKSPRPSLWRKQER